MYKGKPSCLSTVQSPKKSRPCTKESQYIEVHHIGQSPGGPVQRNAHTGPSMYTLIKVCDRNNDFQKGIFNKYNN